MLTVVIPMAGRGSRFAKAGFTSPKPFIPVEGRPMIARVIENLSYPDARYILIGRKEHLKAECDLVKRLEESYNATFLGVDQITEGTACTVLFARHLFDPQKPLLIANCDQIIDGGILEYVEECFAKKRDGSILTFVEPTGSLKWSYARVDREGVVCEVAEKKAISSYATAGLYLFSKASTFIDSAVDMIIHNDRVNGEFYTCPVYNYAIKGGKKIGIYTIAAQAMYGIGTPEDLDLYLRRKRCMS